LHHTKVKADIGVAKVIADLTLKGYVPCIPLSEHQPYDIVVVLDDGSTYKIQVKYATLKKNGTIEVKFRTSWADKNGTHIKHYKQGDFDYYAIYCPDKEIVLYIPNSSNYPKAIRFDKPTNNQTKFIKWANDYLEIKRESSETICHTPEMVKT
jgi:hypothetical protein